MSGVFDRLNKPPLGKRDCRVCVHFIRQTESWEMPHIAWYECKKIPSMANLLSFPFRNTKCDQWITKIKR